MTKEIPRIAVIIPAYNAAKTIKDVINTIPDFVEKIIVVDDASKDNTSEIVNAFNNPNVILVKHDKNQGVGAAMKTGYAKALEYGLEIMVKMDSDGQMRPEYLSNLIEPLMSGNGVYAKGNRFTDYVLINRMPLIRRLGNAWLSFLTKLVSGYWNIFDVTNGYTAVLASSYKKIDPSRIANGYFFETSMLIELNIIRAKVVDVEIPACYEGNKSHMNISSVLASFPCLLTKGLLRRFYQRYLIRDFSALTICVLSGLPLFLFGIAYALSLWVFPPLAGEPTPAGTVMLAALPIIIGFQLMLTGLILDIVFTPDK